MFVAASKKVAEIPLAVPVENKIEDRRSVWRKFTEPPKESDDPFIKFPPPVARALREFNFLTLGFWQLVWLQLTNAAARARTLTLVHNVFLVLVVAGLLVLLDPPCSSALTRWLGAPDARPCELPPPLADTPSPTTWAWSDAKLLWSACIAVAAAHIHPLGPSALTSKSGQLAVVMVVARNLIYPLHLRNKNSHVRRLICARDEDL